MPQGNVRYGSGNYDIIISTLNDRTSMFRYISRNSICTSFNKVTKEWLRNTSLMR